MSEPELRPYQRLLVDNIYSSWNSGNQNVLAVLPTGGGKSVCVSEIVKDFHVQNKRGVVIAHRNELVAQMSGHIARRGIWHRIIGPDATITQISKLNRKEFGKTFINPDAHISVGGIDTIVSRTASLTPWAVQQEFWIIDEAHHVTRDNKWGKGVTMFPNAQGLGVTASPCRADGLGLGDHADGVMQDMILGPNMRDLIEMGSLSDYEIVVAEGDLVMTDEDVTASGDFSNAKMRQKAAKSHIVGDVVREYMRRAMGKRAICFATDVERANEIAENFNANGIPAASLSAKSKPAERIEKVEAFRRGEILVLVNVDLFSEGFDCPAAEVVIMARPTMSLGMYLQQFGRALRLSPGKTHGLVIDHVGNWKRHGFPDRPVRWSLDAKERKTANKRDPYDLKTCTGCGKPHEIYHPACPYCGYKIEPGSPQSRNIEQIEGDLVLLDREILAQMRAATELETPEKVAEKATYSGGKVAGFAAKKRQAEKIAAQEELKEAIAHWAGLQRSLGRSDAESYRRYYIQSGVDVLTSLSRDNSRKDYESMTQMIKGWIE